MGKNKEKIISQSTINIIKTFFPFLQWIGKLKDTNVLKKDIFSWMTVAFILIPQSMAYAALAGLPIEVGLYTACIPVIIAALFGTSAQMSTGPTTIISLMTATALAPIAASGSEWYIFYASMLAFMTWIFYILLWSFKLWSIVDFLSHPVIIGFTNGISILTILSQFSKLFWIKVQSWNHFFETIQYLYQALLSGIHIPTVIVAFSSIALLYIFDKFVSKIPGVLGVLILSVIWSYYFWYAQNFGWAIVQTIPWNLPSFSFPFFNDFSWELSLEQFGKMFMFSMIIWLLAFTQTISVAKIVWYQTKQKVSPNRELVAQGLANMSSSLFWGYGVAGSFSKTAVNLKNWASTWFSSVVTWLIVVLTIIFFTPLLYHLPIATLAAIIITSVVSLIKVQPIINAWKVQKHDAIIAVFTFCLTLILSPNIERAIFISIIVSLALYIYRTMRPNIVEVSMYKDGYYRDCELFGLKTSKCVSVVRVDGDIYFANAGYFEDEVLELITEKKDLKVIIFDMEWMNNVDSSWLEMFQNLVVRLQEMELKVYMTNVRIRVTEKFHHYGFLKLFWEKHIYKDIDDAIEHVIHKFWKKADVEMFLEYKKDKHKKPELSKKIMKKIDKK